MDMGQKKAIEEVMAADFTCYDLALYLDTHPCDYRAICLFNQSVQRARYLSDMYQRTYGPLTAHGAAPYRTWLWAQMPWPWEDQ